MRFRKLILGNLDIFILLALVIFVAYFKIFFAGFISGDDFVGFMQNPITHDLTGAYKSLILHSIYYATAFKLFGYSTFVMHTVSFTLHVVITWLVFILMYIMFDKRVALITAFLFAVHPVNSEAASWVSSVGYLINGIFAFTTLIFYSLYKKTATQKYFWLSAALYGLALIFVRSPWVVSTFAALVFLDQFVFEKKLNFKAGAKYLPFIVASLVYGILFLKQEAATRVTELSATFGLDATPLFNRLPYTIYMMLKLYLLPKGLSIFHEGLGISTTSYTVMIVSSLAFGMWLIYAWKKHRVLAGLSLAMVSSILPTFSPVQVAFFIAERYMYFGTAFFSAIVAILIVKAQEKFKHKDLALTLTIALVILYTLRTFVRINDWQNSKNLWLATSKVEPTSARVFNNLGDAYGNEQNFQKSVEAFQRAIELQPNYADALHNLGNTYLQLGQLDLAEKYLMQSWQANPYLYQATFKLGIIEYQKGNLDKALDYFTKTAKLNPNYPEAQQAIQIVNGLKSQRP